MESPNHQPESKCKTKVKTPRTLQEWYEHNMDQCATKGNNILHILLPPDNPHGDIAYGSFKWTEAQQKAWLTERIPPVAMYKSMDMDVGTVPESREAVCVTQTFHGSEDAKVEDGKLFLSPEAQRRVKCAEGADVCVFATRGNDEDGEGEGEVYIVPREKILLSSLEG